MSSQHRLRPRSFRPEPGEYAAAQADLAARGRHMDAFLRACLRRLHQDPDGFLAALRPVWPTVRPQGRPPGDQAGDRTGSPGSGHGASGETGRADRQ